MRAVVVGLGKSGTTALVYAIRSAMPADTQLLFEPRSHVELRVPNVAAKVLLNPKFPFDPAFYRQFDRIVLLVRDPRDLLVSMALYRIYDGASLHADLPKVEQYVELLRAKERDPHAVPFMRILALYDTLSGRPPTPDLSIVRRLNDIVQFHEAFPSCLVYPYEAMVAKRFGAVAQFLSLPEEAMNPVVPASLHRVVRSRRAGTWRDWFCAEDVDYYRPLCSAFMRRYGYADDWTLNGAPRIPAEEASEYVLRIAREGRQRSARIVTRATSRVSDAGSGMPAPMSRNAPCRCGSGKRYKHCCGREDQRQPPAARAEALAAHRAGSLSLADALYRRALEENPGDVDVLHMLGVVQLERLRYREALDLILEAAERTDWELPHVRHNLGLVLAKLLVRGSDAQRTLFEAFLAWDRSLASTVTDDAPLVSIVMPAYNHARFVGEAIASVAAQTYGNIEFIVIDDGSSDDTAEIIEKELKCLKLPAHFLSRPNRGAPATLNEGAALAKGRYLAFLNSDDYYAPDRIAALVGGIARPGLGWGFSLIDQVTAGENNEATGGAVPARSYPEIQRSLIGLDSNSFALLQFNIAVSTGNLFVRRDLFASVGGFRDLRFNHDWDFCLRASALAEPVVVRRPLYFYRWHDTNTIRESTAGPRAEADQILSELIANVWSASSKCTNPLAPQWPGNRALTLTRLLGAGHGALVPVAIMRKLAEEVREKTPLTPTPKPAQVPSRRTAIVVLGMHRSGTSALARVLNLCGVFLPTELRAPNIYHNVTGFWEPESIINLNNRVLHELGGAWNVVDFERPKDAVSDEFAHNVGALLAVEYGEEATILIKDPRVCVLAPAWHAALGRAGYRPVYVVPIRHPLEVAQSLEERGDMTVSEGLALWLSYMQRVVEFSDTCADIAWVRYTDLLDDWRGVVARIGNRLDVALDIASRADEVDRFLEPGLRRQRSDSAALSALPKGGVADDVRALYKVCLDWCDEDAKAAAMPARERGARATVLGAS